MRQKRALVLSPFATTPADAGQRKRVHQVTSLLKQEGFAITFLFYAFEEGWKARADEARLAQMRNEWNEVILWRAGGRVGLPPLNGNSHALDEWWDESLDVMLRQLFSFRYFDVFVVNNVWLSKALDFAPRSTVKILDTHDIFSLRHGCFARLGIGPEFFVPFESGEIAGLHRSDVVLGIQEHDAAWVARHANVESLCLPYAFEPEPNRVSHRSDYLHPNKVVFGFLGSAHAFNIAGLKAYCEALTKIVGRTAAPVELRIAGNVSSSVKTQGPWLLEGYVADESRFLSEIDVAVIPVFDGTGFKVKVADYAAYGIPQLASTHAAIGMALDKRMVAETPAELAEVTVRIALRRPDYALLKLGSERAHRDLTRRAARAVRRLGPRLRQDKNVVVYDLAGLGRQKASCVLLGWSSGLQVRSPHVKQFVIVDEELREELRELGPVGVFFVTDEEVAALPQGSFDVITATNGAASRWEPRARRVSIDALWAEALAPSEGESAITWRSGSAFWHYVIWGWIARHIVDIAAREQRALAASIVVTNSRQRSILNDRCAELFRKIEFVSIEDFEDFYQLLFHVAAGRCASLAVGESRYPARAKILHDLCAVKGVPFAGPTPSGGLVDVKAPAAVAKVLYDQFEQDWRPAKGNRAA